MSRAAAGVYQNRVIISTPGSENAVRLALEKLVLPELPHMIQQINKL
jgi:molybdenum cofactor biosynthesis protein B